MPVKEENEKLKRKLNFKQVIVLIKVQTKREACIKIILYDLKIFNKCFGHFEGILLLA